MRVSLADDAVVLRDRLARVLADAGVEVVAQAELERIAAGETVVDEALVAELLDRRRAESPLDHLTPREREVLGLMADGLTDRGIAERLYVTPNTVETDVRHIIGKLSPSNNRRVQAGLAYLRSA